MDSYDVEVLVYIILFHVKIVAIKRLSKIPAQISIATMYVVLTLD